jgi:hypothetical protein
MTRQAFKTKLKLEVLRIRKRIFMKNIFEMKRGIVPSHICSKDKEKL